MLEKDRDSVLCLAHALEVHKTLSGDDVVAVIERMPGPIVDGTVYADPDFVAAIRTYHDEMLDAHRQSVQKVELEAPTPEPQPVLAGVGGRRRATATATATSRPALPVAVGPDGTPVADGGHHLLLARARR